MRVLIAVDAMIGCSSVQAGTLIGRAWAATGAGVAVVPMADDVDGVRLALTQVGSDAEVIDLRCPLPAHVPAGVVGLVDADERERPLTGLAGVAAATGREQGWDIARVLAADDDAARRAGEVWPDNPDAAVVPGGGAHGGRGLAVLAAGGRLSTGPALCGQVVGLELTARRADLIVTGCDRLDFGSFGGASVLEVVRVATSAARPVIVLTRNNSISARELRSAGIESAHELGEDATPEALSALAARVAASWTR